MKLANPLYYPLAMFGGMLFLVLGTRVLKLSPVVAIPLTGVIVVAAATGLKTRQSNQPEFTNAAVEREYESLRSQAQALALKANELRQEATQALKDSSQLDHLVAIQLACDRIQELPSHLAQMAQRLQGKEALLSTQDLQRQLQTVEQRLKTSDPVARQQLNRLAESLRRNIALAAEGADTRQAQLISLSTLIQDAAGNLQLLQNKLRTANLSEIQQDPELKLLSDQLNEFQQSVDLLLAEN